MLEIADPIAAPAQGRRAAAPRARRLHRAGGDPVAGQGRDDARPARALPARAAARDPDRARRGATRASKRPTSTARKHRGGRPARPRRWTRRPRQLRRLERMHPDGPEAQVVRSYLDWMVELPWSTTLARPARARAARARSSTRTTRTSTGSRTASSSSSACASCARDSRGPILCFVGPPGVGKTSLGRSIARAMGREFVRISLGGVRDEAEIRGHRRTYVGALPGRIIQGLKQAGTNNPVFMLDEIDKLGADFRGDPSSALLEVLDPEQNSALQRPLPERALRPLAGAVHRHREPARHASRAPLRDRMEVIRIPGYTPEEKVEIARSFLIPRQLARARAAGRAASAGRAAALLELDHRLHARGRRAQPRAPGRRGVPQGRAARGRGRRARASRVNRTTLARLLGPPRLPADEPDGHPARSASRTGSPGPRAGGEVLRSRRR